MSKSVSFFLLLAIVIPFSVSAATLTNGMNASDLIGQYSDVLGTNVSYIKSGANNSPNQLGFAIATGILLEPIDHHLFVSEITNNRVLIFNLDSNNNLIDKQADYVLGQPDFTTTTATNTQSGINNPRDMAYDSATHRLFVSEVSGNRVKIFDLSNGITSGMNASFVIGQTTFTGATAADTQAGIRFPYGLAFDSATNRLFVAEYSGNRVKVFNVATTTMDNGIAAIGVLGQIDYSGLSSGNSTSTLSLPIGLSFDATNNRLFVAENAGSRVKVFDVASITNGEDATYVLGQANFSGSFAANSQDGLSSPFGVAFNPNNNQLFVAENGGNRIKIFNVATSTISTGENAVHVLGQTDFAGAAAANTQSGIGGVSGLSLDVANNRLYAVEVSTNRIKVFDVASITDGENAIDLIGQYTDLAGNVLSYTKSGLNNGPSSLGFSAPRGLLVDTTFHRLFVAESLNHRVLVFNLNSDNRLIDHIPDFVLGQADFISNIGTSTQSGLNVPIGLAFDASSNRLFVSEATNANRVKVFDLTSISNGENAVNVLGQADFIGNTAANSKSGLNGPTGLVFDQPTNRLFVSEQGGHRIKVFNVATSTISDGEDASAVIGQADFTSAGAADTQTGLNSPQGLAIDSTTNRLFVSEFSGNRVKVFNVATSTMLATSSPAINVLGQLSFAGASPADTQTGLRAPYGVTINPLTKQLFVSEQTGNRVKIFDIATSTITDGEGALYVLGQTTFSGAAAVNTQDGLNSLSLGLDFDPSTNFLYVAEIGGNRIKIFDLSPDAGFGTSIYTAPSGGGGGTNEAWWLAYAAANGLSTSTATTTASSTPSTDSGCIPGNIFSTTTGVRCTTQSSVPSTTFPITTGGIYIFKYDLKLNMTHLDVKLLQHFLNTHGYPVSLTGAGSLNNETTLFGPKTKAAVIKFQTANHIQPNIGYFGPITRELISKSL